MCTTAEFSCDGLSGAGRLERWIEITLHSLEGFSEKLGYTQKAKREFQRLPSKRVSIFEKMI